MIGQVKGHEIKEKIGSLGYDFCLDFKYAMRKCALSELWGPKIGVVLFCVWPLHENER